jgi:glucose/arabinose dehydrogenase
MIYSASLFPEWTDSLFVSTLVDNDVKRLVINDEAIVSEDVLFAEFEARIRAVVEGPQGELYLLTDSENGQIIEIVPSVQDDPSEMDNPREPE